MQSLNVILRHTQNTHCVCAGRNNGNGWKRTKLYHPCSGEWLSTNTYWRAVLMRCCDTNPFQTNKKTKLDKINFENLCASFFAFDFDVYFLVQAIASYFMFIYSSWHGFHDELICSLPFDKAVDSLNTEQLLSTSFQRTWERVRRNDFTFISRISFKIIYHENSPEMKQIA